MASANLKLSSYKFGYGVNDAYTGDVKEQSETKDCDTVTGYYKTLDADGLMRTVTYLSHPLTGFQADVRREPYGVPINTVAAPILRGAAIVPAPLLESRVAPVAARIAAPGMRYGLPAATSSYQSFQGNYQANKLWSAGAQWVAPAKILAPAAALHQSYAGGYSSENLAYSSGHYTAATPAVAIPRYSPAVPAIATAAVPRYYAAAPAIATAAVPQYYSAAPAIATAAIPRYYPTAALADCL